MREEGDGDRGEVVSHSKDSRVEQENIVSSEESVIHVHYYHVCERFK